MLKSRRLALTAVVAATSIALAGCSSTSDGTGSPAPAGNGSSSAPSSSSAPKPTDATSFVSDSLDAFQQAPSAHVKGSGTSGGDSVAFDLKYGKDVAIGIVTLQGKTIELSKVDDGTTYFKAETAFWTSVGVPADTAATLGGKYVKITSDATGFSDIAKLLDRTEFVDQFRPSSSDLDGAKITGPTEVNGVSCYGVEDSNGQGAFYAAADGTPYPVQLKAGTEGTFDFDGYTDAVTVPAPDPADVVSLPGS